MLKKLLTILLLCALPLTGAMGEIVSLSADGAPGLRYDYDRYATENGYEDPSISVTIYNGQMEETKYIYALVKIAQPNQLRTALAYKVNSSRTYKPALIAERNNAVLAVNGDFCNFDTKGYLVRQGVFYYNRAYKTMDVLIIDQNGDFHVITEPTVGAVEDWQRDHPDLQVVNSFDFGPAIIVDGERAHEDLNTAGNASVARGHLRFARTVLCQLEGELTYLALCCQGDQDGHNLGFTYEELYTCIRAIEHEQGITVRVAYNMDGGYSSAMVLHNEKINWPENGVNREVSDIVYFASAWQKE